MNKFININKYISRTPTFNKIVKAIRPHIKGVDHIALRTFNPMNIYQICKKHGYQKQPNIYHFPLYNSTATYYLNTKENEIDNVPRIFVSSYNEPLYDHNYTNQLDFEIIDFYRKSDKKFTYNTYKDIYDKNQYLAWTLCFRDEINHIALEVDNIDIVNKKVKEMGIKLNTDNGEIKVSQDGLLMQSSTKSEEIPYQFSDDKYNIPYGFVEFVERGYDENNVKREGFEENNALYIFNSTKK